MDKACIGEVLDRVYARMELLEHSLTPILSREDLKGEALRVLGIIEEIYDGLAELKGAIEKDWCRKPS
ncbi:MAG: hypothetical protein GSR86_06495 [Desulfurococcales archaeon]|nr:hypothetical protein [Desulfurococcales archaeon]